MALVIGLLAGGSALGEVALGTAFTYQGQLKKDGAPVQGACDLEFALHDAATGGAQVGPTQTVLGHTAVNGLFTVQLDFGQGAFDGNARWLQISVRLPGGAGWSTLSPRQPLTPTPYALLAVEAAGLKLPITASVGSAAPALRITNTDTGLALQLANTGDGTTLQVDSESTEPALRVANAGSGHAGWFEGGKGLYATSSTVPTGAAISATNSGGGDGVRGTHAGTGNFGILGGPEDGVSGKSSVESGVSGESTTGCGVSGDSSAWIGVFGLSVSNLGVYGLNEQTGNQGHLGSPSWGVKGTHSSGTEGCLGGPTAAVVGFGNGKDAALFWGRVQVNGVLGATQNVISENGNFINGYIGVLDVENDLTVGGAALLTELTVAGSFLGNWAELTGDLKVANNMDGRRGHFTEQLFVDGDMNVGGTLLVLGDASILGTLHKSAGTFRIDHPLDPANKYLYHSFVESPDMMNVYNGNITLDAKGEAWVELPKWFEALNRDFRYQLTCIGGFAPVHIAAKIQGNRFQIAGGKPGMEVSWQVTGIRQDPYANAHRIIVEQDKAPEERGYYLHPKAYGQPEEKRIQHVRNARTRALAQRPGRGDE